VQGRGQLEAAVHHQGGGEDEGHSKGADRRMTQLIRAQGDGEHADRDADQPQPAGEHEHRDAER
jgi:hypothetical protein